MRLRVPVVVVLVLAVVVGALTALAGCGGGSADKAATSTPQAPNPGTGEQRPAQADEQEAATSLGFPGFATKNTTRVGGADAVADAAAVALAVFPPGRNAPRPDAGALAAARDWRPAPPAAAPTGAPVPA